MKHFSFLLSLLAGCLPAICAFAQVEIDQPIQMTGATNAEKQITGLGNPSAGDHAVNASSAQSGSLIYASSTGAANAYVVSLIPAVAAYTTGMTVNFSANAANTGPATLDLGSGVKAIKKQVSVDLVANDIKSGQIVTVIYDGTNFQMTSASGNSAGGGSASCPSGFTSVNNNFCIEPSERTSSNWVTAYTTCAAQGTGTRLCDQVDFYYACTQAGTLGLNNMNNNDEWAAGQDNGNPGMKTIAQSGSCSTLGWRNISDLRTYRCCFYK